MSDDGIRKGGRGDPVAQSIRNEQMQDAAPSEAEREEIAREGNTCDKCGEHKPGEVGPRHQNSYTPDCDAQQQRAPAHGRVPPLLCDDCAPEVETKLDIIEQHFIEGDDYVVEYGCGVLKPIDREVAAQKVRADRPAGSIPLGWSPNVGIEHRCGKTIERVWTADDAEVFADGE